MSSELMLALDAIEEERGIAKEVIIEAIETALTSVYKKNYDPNTNIKIKFDTEDGDVAVLGSKTVVEEVYDEASEITLKEAQVIDPDIEIGDSLDKDITPKSFSRIAAQMAKQVMIQRIREAERGIIYDEYIEKENEVLTGTIQRIERHAAYIELGKIEGVLNNNEMIPGEKLFIGKRIRVYVLQVRKSSKGPQVMVSRTHPLLVKRMFEMEVPEIQSGVVQIKSIAREAGYRTKVSVFSTDDDVDSLGACVGHKGMRVEVIVNELNGEKIDIIRYSDDPVEYISNSLSPAKVLMVKTNVEDKIAKVVVPDNQLSLAIGKEGQNARLAAKLTGWKIDIKCQSDVTEEFFGTDDEDKALEILDEILDEEAAIEKVAIIEDDIMSKAQKDEVVLEIEDIDLPDMEELLDMDIDIDEEE